MANRNAKLQHATNEAEREARFKSLLAKRGGYLDQVDKPTTSKLIDRTMLQLEHFTYVYPPIRQISTMRPLKTQDQDKIRQAVALHLYGKYPTPLWLKNAWLEAPKDVPPNIKNSSSKFANGSFALLPVAAFIKPISRSC